MDKTLDIICATILSTPHNNVQVTKFCANPQNSHAPCEQHFVGTMGIICCADAICMPQVPIHPMSQVDTSMPHMSHQIHTQIHPNDDDMTATYYSTVNQIYVTLFRLINAQN